MFTMRSPHQPTVYFDKPKGPVYELGEVIPVILLGLHIRYLEDKSLKTLDRPKILSEIINRLLPSMDDGSLKVMMSVLTGCGKQIKLRGAWVDRGEFEFDTWVAEMGYRDLNHLECKGITEDWLRDFVNHGKPLNVMMLG